MWLRTRCSFWKALNDETNDGEPPSANQTISTIESWAFFRHLEFVIGHLPGVDFWYAFKP